MPNYSFEYIKGQSKPSKTIEADDDYHAQNRILNFIEDEGGTLVPGSIKGSINKTWHVPDPPEPIQPKQKERYRVEL